MSETREGYSVTATPTKDLPADAETIRQKLTELVPLVKWRVVGVADSRSSRLEIIGSVVISEQAFSFGYSLSAEQYYYTIKKREGGWQALSGLLAHNLADAILAWRPNESA